MLNWTEEDVKFITEQLIAPCVEMLAKETVKLDGMSDTLYTKVFDVMAKRIKELDYQRQRDKSFFLAFLGQKHYFSQDTMNKVYENYCNEYDKLNKYLLEEAN